MATNDPVGTVQRMFAAFRTGDLDALLDTVDAETRWTVRRRQSEADEGRTRREG